MNPSLNMGTWKHLQEFQMEIPNSSELRRINLKITDSGAIHKAEEILAFFWFSQVDYVAPERRGSKMGPLKKPNVESAKQANKNTWKEKFESQEKDQERGRFQETKWDRVQERKDVWQCPILPRHWQLASRLNKEVGSVIRQSCLLPRQKISGPPKKG